MMLIPLVGGKYFAKVDDADFDRLSQFRWYAHIAKWRRVKFDGEGGKIYAVRRENNRSLLMHREIMASVPKKKQIDHANGDGLDNQRSNLREATSSENQINRKLSRARSGYRGVTYRPTTTIRGQTSVRKRPWVVNVSFSGRTQNIGSFESAEQAAKVYDRVVKLIYGDFAPLNLPDSKTDEEL